MKEIQYSIIVTCHNQREFIADAIESALAQDHPNHEVIVVNDASSDGSDAIVEKYSGRAKVVQFRRNVGAAAARNGGAAVASGSYLLFLDGDDVLKPWALSVYDEIIQKYRPSLVLATLTWFRGAPPACGEGEAPREIEVVNYEYLAQKDRSYRSSASALVIERTAFDSVLGWAREAAPFEDQHLEAKLAFSGRAITVVRPQTVFYRLHTNNTIHDVEKIIRGCYGFVSAPLPPAPSRKLGDYFGRTAIIGGPAMWAVKKAFRAKLYADGTKLLARVSPWVAAAALVRLRAKLAGLRPTEKLVFHSQSGALLRDVGNVGPQMKARAAAAGTGATRG